MTDADVVKKYAGKWRVIEGGIEDPQYVDWFPPIGMTVTCSQDPNSAQVRAMFEFKATTGHFPKKSTIENTRYSVVAGTTELKAVIPAGTLTIDETVVGEAPDSQGNFTRMIHKIKFTKGGVTVEGDWICEPCPFC